MAWILPFVRVKRPGYPGFDQLKSVFDAVRPDFCPGNITVKYRILGSLDIGEFPASFFAWCLEHSLTNRSIL